MDLSVEKNISENCASAKITVWGMIDTLDSERFFSELERLPEEAQNIEFDLENVPYISSSGLRVLLKAMDMAEDRGGVMKVVKSSEFVREILAAVGFDKLFEVA